MSGSPFTDPRHGVCPAFSAAIMIGAPWASSAQTKCTSLPTIL